MFRCLPFPWQHVAAVLLLAAATMPAAAQPAQAELFGTVRDPAALPVSGARVELTHIASGAIRSTHSDASGSFHFFALPPGGFRVAVQKDGFATLRRDGLDVRPTGRLRLDLDLRAGSAVESVTVTGAAPLLQSSRGSAGVVVAPETVTAAPLDGRNVIPLLALAPGVSLPPGGTFPRVNGGRPRVSEYVYDGVSVLQPEPGQVAFYPIVESIEELRIDTNSPPAEFGRFNGGVVIVHQKAGSNQLRGTAFGFLRNEALNARNLFAGDGPKPDFRRQQYGLVLGGPIERNRTFFFTDWQGTRLNNEAVRVSTVPLSEHRRGVFAQPVFDPRTTRRTPTGYARDPFPGTGIPAQRFDPAALAVLERYPAPNVVPGASEAIANNYRRRAADSTAQDQFSGRLDRHFGTRHRIFVRYTHLRDEFDPSPPLPDGSGALAGVSPGRTVTRAAGLAAEYSWTLHPRAVNQLRLGYTRRAFRRSSLSTGLPASEVSRIPNLTPTSFHDVLPTYDLAGLQHLGPPASANARQGTSVAQFLDDYSWLQGRHGLKVGADIRLERLDVLQPPSPAGNFQFTPALTAGLDAAGTPASGTGHSFASFLLGQVNRFSIDAQGETLKPRATVAEFYAQDDWRATQRLTLNLGIRYTLNFPSTVVGDRGAVFNLNTQRLDYLGRNGFPHSARNLEATNFGPRLGLAYRTGGHLVIRSGYGLIWIEQAGITTPFTTPLFPFIQTLSQQTLDNIYPAFVLSAGPSVVPQAPGPDVGLGQAVFGVQQDNGSGYAQQWNLSLQRTSGENWSIEAGYLGSKLTRLGVPDVNLNQLTVEQLALGARLVEQAPNPHFGQIPTHLPLGAPMVPGGQLLRPFPRFTTVALYRNNTGHSTYHSLQARLEKRLSRGLTLSGAYTFSRLIDDAGAVFDSAAPSGPAANFQAADSFNKQLEKDVSTGSLPHVLAGSFVYEWPFGRGRARALAGWREALAGGWRTAGIVRLQSGGPIAVTQAANSNAFAGFGIQRPNRIADPELPRAQRTPERWFRTSAFAEARPFTIGNSSRNPVSGPGYRTLDVMLGKSFAIAERVRAEFRAEAFNVTNTPPLANPNGSFGAAGFGSIAAALDPRVLALVLKLHF